VLRQSAGLPCSVQRGKHRRVFERALRFRGLAISIAGWRRAPRRRPNESRAALFNPRAGAAAHHCGDAKENRIGKAGLRRP
jgi:hypothetical protein